MSASIAARRAAFRALHEQGCFVIPNPWDVGSALYLQHLGFKALASSSAGFAWSQGLADYRVSRARVLAHLRTLVEATELPINADFEAGFADTPEGVAQSVRMAVDTGVAGLSIEDSSGLPDAPIRDLDDALARLTAARKAIDETGGDTLLVGRAENFLHGRNDIEDTITRLKAYAEAGADCLYAPAVRERAHIEAIVQAVAPKPVNLLVGSASEFSVDDIAAMGVRRISIGGALARTAWAGMEQAITTLQGTGRFDGFAHVMQHAALNALFADRSDN